VRVAGLEGLSIGSVSEASALKMWIFEERLAFDAPAPDALNPPRWVAHGATRSRKAPLLDYLTIDIKGSPIHHQGELIYISELKLDRPVDLFSKGYT
jgi:hypothetical protein